MKVLWKAATWVSMNWSWNVHFSVRNFSKWAQVNFSLPTPSRHRDRETEEWGTTVLYWLKGGSRQRWWACHKCDQHCYSSPLLILTSFQHEPKLRKEGHGQGGWLSVHIGARLLSKDRRKQDTGLRKKQVSHCTYLPSSAWKATECGSQPGWWSNL